MLLLLLVVVAMAIDEDRAVTVVAFAVEVTAVAVVVLGCDELTAMAAMVVVGVAGSGDTTPRLLRPAVRFRRCVSLQISSYIVLDRVAVE